MEQSSIDPKLVLSFSRDALIPLHCFSNRTCKTFGSRLWVGQEDKPSDFLSLNDQTGIALMNLVTASIVEASLQSSEMDRQEKKAGISLFCFIDSDRSQHWLDHP